MSQNDQILTSGLISGNQQAYNQLYDQFYKPLCKYAFKYVRSLEAAEDIVQETFLKIWNLKKQLNPDSNIASYLFRSIRNNSIDYIKSSIKEKELRQNLLLNAQLISEDAVSVIEGQELSEQLLKLIESIPDKSRRVFEMSRYKGLRHQEIATELNITIKGVEYHISKALRHLEKELNNYV